MEQSSERSVAMKSFAIIGFIIAIIFIVWLVVRVVALIPGAFSSLASIADGVYNNRPQSELTVATQNTIINHNQSFNVNWSDTNKAGTYTFTYECTDGIAVDIKHSGSRITPVECGEVVNLGDETFSLDMIAQSERNRFSDVPYTIGFVPESTKDEIVTKDSVFTVVNVNIPQSGLASADTEDTTPEVVTETEAETVTEPEVETPAVTTPTTPAPTTPAVTPTPVYVSTPVYSIPQSDPNGSVDLAVRYLQVGRLDSRNNFIPGGEFDNDARAAFQFEVKNIGTKTSDSWTFKADLTSGSTYSSKSQAGLKPNERSVLTIGFDNVGDLGAQRFGADVNVRNDINTRNNAFQWAVFVVN